MGQHVVGEDACRGFGVGLPRLAARGFPLSGFGEVIYHPLRQLVVVLSVRRDA
ncbi:hypothetical protein GHK86_11035 [Acidimicrobiaceae bacterium USS-CC1]|uniref:Uncharacterized protein n=1 Tax=Acidiferrimicrobium australe TaxID=2664430 RepID=A0ABW9QVE8_9ACTN|nr:hypothetical protein [Acidiferrimicrobium australe]